MELVENAQHINPNAIALSVASFQKGLLIWSSIFDRFPGVRPASLCMKA